MVAAAVDHQSRSSQQDPPAERRLEDSSVEMCGLGRIVKRAASSVGLIHVFEAVEPAQGVAAVDTGQASAAAAGSKTLPAAALRMMILACRMMGMALEPEMVRSRRNHLVVGVAHIHPSAVRFQCNSFPCHFGLR